jgi:hypothetical protein
MANYVGAYGRSAGMWRGTLTEGSNRISQTNRVMAPWTPSGTRFGRLTLAEGAKKNGRKVVTKRARHPTPKHSHAGHDMASLSRLYGSPTPNRLLRRRLVAKKIGARLKRLTAQLLAVNLPRDHVAHIRHVRIQFDRRVRAGLACIDHLDVFRVVPQLVLEKLPHFLLTARLRDITHDQIHTAYPRRV